jgi:ribosomal protein L7Ae-like RNA K-turn-binding protein
LDAGRELGEYKRIRVKKERKKRKAPPAGDQSASTTNTPSANKNKKKRTKKTNKKTKNKEDKTTATATGTPAAVPKDKDVMELEGEAEQKEVMQVATKPLKERSGKTQAKDTEADAEARETARQKLIAKRQEVREKCTFMAVGLNAVTKALEDKQLEVVVVCKVRQSDWPPGLVQAFLLSLTLDQRNFVIESRRVQDVEPARLVQHIPVQAFLTGVPLVPLSGGLSLRLGAIFGIRTVMAIGFKVSSPLRGHPQSSFPGMSWCTDLRVCFRGAWACTEGHRTPARRFGCVPQVAGCPTQHPLATSLQDRHQWAGARSLHFLPAAVVG